MITNVQNEERAEWAKNVQVFTHHHARSISRTFSPEMLKKTINQKAFYNNIKLGYCLLNSSLHEYTTPLLKFIHSDDAKNVILQKQLSFMFTTNLLTYVEAKIVLSWSAWIFQQLLTPFIIRCLLTDLRQNMASRNLLYLGFTLIFLIVLNILKLATTLFLASPYQLKLPKGLSHSLHY
ncbi:hypothetical protein HELRODRAFT_165093 [Helobdella robusta]|uniref:Uncharacterized protein n=1 Tax=Helobdella robusta TaxID=6412 RepID=T1EWA3_HELRO|nr:hypothetical protein HELRODRAFT_165093 [Helobdella robusta]ESN92950.1 hypothetical protein HELRODRAFT_165093 [Helobdella robusta]